MNGVNMKVYDAGVHHIEVSKELEIINFNVLQEKPKNDEPKQESFKHWILNDGNLSNKSKRKVKDQFTLFQKAMKVLLVWGQFMGLNPVTGLLQNDVTKMRFTIRSWKFSFTVFTALTQTIATCSCVYRLFKGPLTLRFLGYLSFFTTTWFTTIIFIRIATKWPSLMKTISTSKLDEYIDDNIIKKCNIACIALIGMGFMEHTLSILSKVAKLVNCTPNVTDYEDHYNRMATPWLYDLNLPNSRVLAIIAQYVNLTATATWNYVDLFIVCISIYLTSILNQINKRIALSANMNYLPAKIWSILRDDYTRATRLIRLFDDVFSSLILVTFANDLFFICIQLFYILANGLRSAQVISKSCTKNPGGLLRGYEFPIYLMYSTMYLLVRFLIVSLVAAKVHSASKEPAYVLYKIPTTAYTKEVERFLYQVKSDVVALSGLQFFYITRELLLSIAGTIVTYELVLLQFSNGE